MIVSDEKMQKALHYLAETDDQAAHAKSLLSGLEEQKKTIFSIEYLKVRDGSVEERKARASASNAVQEHAVKIERATYDYEIIRNKRLTAQEIISVWKSLNANRRQGA